LVGNATFDGGFHDRTHQLALLGALQVHPSLPLVAVAKLQMPFRVEIGQKRGRSLLVTCDAGDTYVVGVFEKFRQRAGLLAVECDVGPLVKDTDFDAFGGDLLVCADQFTISELAVTNRPDDGECGEIAVVGVLAVSVSPTTLLFEHTSKDVARTCA